MVDTAYTRQDAVFSGCILLKLRKTQYFRGVDTVYTKQNAVLFLGVDNAYTKQDAICLARRYCLY